MVASKEGAVPSSRLSSIVGREQASEPDCDDDDSLPRLKNDFWLVSRRSMVIRFLICFLDVLLRLSCEEVEN